MNHAPSSRLEPCYELFGIRDPSKSHFDDKERCFVIAPRQSVPNHLGHTVTKKDTGSP